MLIHHRPSRRGFTMMEIVVALIVLALLGAVITTAVVSRVQEGRAASLAQTLGTLSDAILEFRADVRRYPTHLRYLYAAPPTNEVDLCNQTVPASFRTSWRGPYVKSSITTSGLTVDASTIPDAVELDPTGPYTVSTTGAIVIVVQDVDSTVANELEARFDGNATWGSGNIRYVAGSGQLGTLRFAVPVRGC